jgi:diketogulonate reductase-like aldo/keto reductase
VSNFSVTELDDVIAAGTISPVVNQIPVISKSVHRERLQENAQIFTFTLSAEDMAELDALDTTHDTGQALERTWW